MRKKFLRTSWRKKPSLGLRRKKKQKWRRARGRHNKIREKRKGRICRVEIGFRTDKKQRGRINGKLPVLVKNLNDAEKLGKNEIAIIASIGKKKRLLVENKIKEKQGEIYNESKK